MRQAKTSSTRYAYLFVSVNLILLVAFFLSMSVTVRQVDSSRARYDKLARDWYALRVTMVQPTSRSVSSERFHTFDHALEGMFRSELFAAAERLYKPLAISADAIMREWSQLRPRLADSVLHGDPYSAGGPENLVRPFQDALLGIGNTIEDFVSLQQRAIQILLYFLGATIIATVAIFFFVESELASERRAAALVQSFARGSIAAQEQERERIARALHDSLAQELTLTMFEIGDLTNSGSLATSERIKDRLRAAVDWIRGLAHELHPAEIDQLGLAGAIRSYCLDVAGSNQATVEWTVSDLPFSVSRAAALNLYRIVQEAVTNALRHANPQRIQVTLEIDAGYLLLVVEDDGRGFNRHTAFPPGGSARLGLVSMEERAHLLHAELAIDSAPNKGTRISVRVPVPALETGEE